MIIIRPNYKKAFLTFAADGTINLNKKTIGLWWTLRHSINEAIKFKAKVYLNQDKMTILYGVSKYNLLDKIRNSIENNMLTKEFKSCNC